MLLPDRPRSALRRAPVLFGMAMLLLPWAYLLWNTTLGELTPHLRLRNRNTVAGVFGAAIRDASRHDWLVGAAQRGISEEIGRMTPIFSTALRLNAQFFYSVFGKSPYKLFGTEGLDVLFVGPGRELYQWPYVREYCTRDAAQYTPAIAAGARDLRALQDRIEARGQAFLYLTTPSKVATLDHLPASLRCPATEADRIGKLAASRAALREAGVHVVDAATDVATAQRTSAMPLFARGSSHWNELAAAMAAASVTQALDAGPARLTPFTFRWQRSELPLGMDRELVDAVHLLWPDDRFPVPVLSYDATPPIACHKLRITEVGGSFLFRLNAVLSRQPCPPDIHLWFYWERARIGYPGEVWEKPDAAQRARDLREADVVIAEENEAVLPRSPHLRALMEAEGVRQSP